MKNPDIPFFAGNLPQKTQGLVKGSYLVVGEEYKATLTELSDQERQNTSSALKDFFEVMEIHSRRVDNFSEKEVERVLVFYRGMSKLAKSTLPGYCSSVRHFFTYVREKNNVLKAPKNFGPALEFFAKQRGTNLFALSQRLGVHHSVFQDWGNGKKTPAANSRAIVEQIEVLLDLPSRTLIEKCPRLKREENNAPPTHWTLIARLLLKKKYVLPRSDWPEKPDKQFDAYFKYRTGPICVPDPDLLHDKDLLPWTIRDGVCNTADTHQYYIESYFGFLHADKSPDPLISGLEMPIDEIDFEKLANAGFLIAYMHFKARRAGFEIEKFGECYQPEHCSTLLHSGFTRSFVAFAVSLLRPKFGFVWLHCGPKDRTSKKSFQIQCEKTRHNLYAFLRRLEADAALEFARDPREPIQDILDRQHPTLVLTEMATAIKEDYDMRIGNKRTMARLYQELMFVNFIRRRPWRKMNFEGMTYCEGDDKRSNLYHRGGSKGPLWVRIKKKDFKNRHSPACEDFDGPLPPDLAEMVNTFITDHRPHLLGADKCNFLFRPSRIGKKGLTKLTEKDLIKHFGSLDAVMRRLSKRFIPGCPGFGTQAVRHIVATDYVRNHPASYYIAAKLLNDSVEMVEATYSWVKKSDYAADYDNYLDDIADEGPNALEWKSIFDAALIEITDGAIPTRVVKRLLAEAKRLRISLDTFYAAVSLLSDGKNPG